MGSGDTADQWADQLQIVTLGSLRIQVGGPGKQPTGLGFSRRNPVNPAAAVRGPKHVVTKGATPVLSPAEARRLLEALDTAALAGRRDRALVSVMLYSFARVSAVIAMRKQDYFRQESRGWLRLHEKGGKRHDVPAHHRAAEALDDYIEAAGPAEAKAALFQSVDPAGRRLTDGPGAVAASRPGDDQASSGGRGSAAVDLLPHVPGRRGSRRICRTGGRSNTPSGSPAMRRPRRRSSTTGRRTRSASTRSSAS